MIEALDEILNGCIKREYKYQKLLYSKYASLFYAICLRYLKNTDAAKDALQDGFMKIYNSISKYSGNGSFEGWMKRVMVNTCLLQLRENRKLQTTELASTHELVSEEEEEVFSLPSEQLFKLLQELPDGYRTIFNMYVLDEFTHKEIAEQLGIAEGTSKSQLARAKMLLKEKVAKYTNAEKAR